MENKKLVKILTKDMAELEELISEVKLQQKFDALEMEFIHTRAKGVLQLLQLLNSSEEPVILQTDEKNNLIKKLKDKVENVSKLASEIAPEQEDEEMDKEEPEEKPLPGVVPEPPEKEEVDVIAEELAKEPLKKEEEKGDEEMLQEEAPKSEATSRLGDSFLKGKSVNDVINEQVKLEYKLSNRPVSSIQSAIGINDRFQYIRELFDGDSKKFVEAVKTLDSMSNIREAIDFLRAHYKWNRNETSLKFVNLVKRRFQSAAAGS